MQLIAQIVAGLIALAGPASLAVQYTDSIPPQPEQTSIVCHDGSWEATNLQPVSGAQIQTKLVPFTQMLLQDAKAENISLGITSAYRSCGLQLALRTQACGL